MNKESEMSRRAAALVCLVALIFYASCRTPEKVSYPVTPTGSQVDDYFGTKVADPYRWLEDENSAEVTSWVERQNELTFSYLAKIPFRQQIRERLDEINNYPRYSAPTRAGEYYFFSKNDGLQNQPVIYVQKGLEGPAEVFIDPNALAPDGTVRVNLAGFSRDHRFAAYARSEAGSDWQELRVREIATKQDLPDVIRWVKFTAASWQGTGFYYSGFEKPEESKELSQANAFEKVYYHKLGDPQDKDMLVFEDREHPLRYHSVDITEDERFLFLTKSEGTSGNELYYKDLAKRYMEFKPLVTGFEHNAYVVEAVSDKFLVHTDIDAPNYRLVLIDSKFPARENWQDIIREGTEVLESVTAPGGYLFCTYLKDASMRVVQHEIAGPLVRDVSLPGLGTASGFTGKRDEKVVYYTFSSFNRPPTIFRYDLASGETAVFRRPEAKFNPEDYDVKQVFYASQDGTKVPMFIVHRRGLRPNGKNPTYLYAYGGFNSSSTPGFDASRLILLENGAVYALACLRGGGEYGEAWHRAGMRFNKQNVFDDFIAAAEYLIREKYTSPERLAIAGGSNGGLLVGACMTQRPDLFRVALPAVGVMDMLRFHRFTVGWGWVVEYGTSDNAQDFRNLYAYSPLHNIKDGVCYPATLVTTADHDDRVVPGHSYKFTAALQEKQACGHPVLIRVETRSGHGASSTTKRLDETADKYAFMFHAMRLKIYSP